MHGMNNLKKKKAKGYNYVLMDESVLRLLGENGLKLMA